MLRLIPARRLRTLSSSSYRKVFGKTKTTTEHVCISVGLASGIVGSLCGVAGGPVILPALRQFTALTTKQISATSLFCVSISAAFGGFSYVQQGFANLPISGLLISTSVLPTFLGSYLMAKIPCRYLLRVTAFLMCCAGPAI